MDYQEARAALEAAMAKAKLTMTFARLQDGPCDYGPFGAARWNVQLLRDGKLIYETKYSAGCLAALKNAKPATHDEQVALQQVRAGGRSIWHRDTLEGLYRRAKPDPVDVLWCLISDADVDNYTDFEDWAESLGFDTDSRKAERSYQQCQACAKALRGVWRGADEWEAVQALAREF